MAGAERNIMDAHGGWMECLCERCSCGSKGSIISNAFLEDVEDEFDSEFDECEEDEAILKAMLLAQEYYLLYGDEGNITSCAKVEHDLMFRCENTSSCFGVSSVPKLTKCI